MKRLLCLVVICSRPAVPSTCRDGRTRPHPARRHQRIEKRARLARRSRHDRRHRSHGADVCRRVRFGRRCAAADRRWRRGECRERLRLNRADVGRRRPGEDATAPRPRRRTERAGRRQDDGASRGRASGQRRVDAAADRARRRSQGDGQRYRQSSPGRLLVRISATCVACSRRAAWR